MNEARFEQVAKKVFPELDDDLVPYIASILEENQNASAEALEETLSPILTGYEVVPEEEIAKRCKLLPSKLHSKKPKKEEEPKKTHKLDRPLMMNNLEEIEKKTTAASLLWNPQKLLINTNDDIDEKKNLEMLQARKERAERRAERRKMANSPTEEVYEAEAPKLSVNMEAQGKTMDISVEDVTVGVPGKQLVIGASLRLVYGHKYGLIGRNGIGKSTLLRHIARRQVNGFPAHISVMYVEQEIPESEESVLAQVLKSNTILQTLTAEKEAIETKTKTDSASEAEILRLQHIYQEIANRNLATPEVTAGEILKGLGFTREMMNEPTSKLSGGWRMRVSLAAALFSSPDLLLLDEPTNHLDIGTVIWLENFLEAYDKTLVVVSHDRHFLNYICTDIMLIKDQQLLYFKGNYDTYEKVFQEERLNYERERTSIQGQIDHLMIFINRFRVNANRAPQVQSKLKVVKKLQEEMDAIPVIGEDPMLRFQFMDPPPLTFPILQSNDVTFGWDLWRAFTRSYTKDRILFRDINFGIDFQSRIGILGPNGIGKSTLVKLLLGDLVPMEGQVIRNHKLRCAVFTQHHLDQLDFTKSPLQIMKDHYPTTEIPQLRSQLARFGVTEDMADRPVKTLSGGQKTRVSFAMITNTNPHIMVLDEPTNHLDIETIEALANALNKFQGGVIVVSHDQFFISRVCKELWTIRNQSIIRFNGEFEEYKNLVSKGKI